MSTETGFSIAARTVAEKLYYSSQEALYSEYIIKEKPRAYRILKNKDNKINPKAFLVCLTSINPLVLIPLFDGVNKVGRGNSADIIYDINYIFLLEAQQWDITIDSDCVKIRDWYSSNESKILSGSISLFEGDYGLVTEEDISRLKQYNPWDIEGELIPHISKKSDWITINNFDFLVNVYSIFMFARVLSPDEVRRHTSAIDDQ